MKIFSNDAFVSCIAFLMLLIAQLELRIEEKGKVYTLKEMRLKKLKRLNRWRLFK